MREAAELLDLDIPSEDVIGTDSQEETAANIHELAQSDRADQMGKYGRALVSGPGQFKPVVYWKPARRPCTGGGVSWRGGLLNGIDGKNGNDKSHLSHQSHSSHFRAVFSWNCFNEHHSHYPVKDRIPLAFRPNSCDRGHRMSRKRKTPRKPSARRAAEASPVAAPEAGSFAKQIFVAVTAFTGGAGIMVIEMAGNRVLAPIFGNSLYTWTGLIGVVLLSISVGYYVGGYLADKFTSWVLLSHLLAGSAVGVLFIPIVQNLMGTGIDRFDIVWGPVIASIFLFTIPGVVMGAVTPVAIRLRSVLGADKHVGLSAGQIGMVGTLGSVCGTFAGGFVLIPLVRLSTLFIMIAGVLGGLACVGYALFGAGRERVKTPVVLASILVLMAWAGLAGEGKQPDGVLHDETSFYHRIRVLESVNANGHVERTLQLDSTVEGAQVVGHDYIPIVYQNYWELVRVFAPEPGSAAFVGGGAFLMPLSLADAYPSAKVDVFELDPKVIEVGEKFFRLGDYPSVRAVAGDARRQIRLRDARYDMIFGDAYNGVRYVPAHLVTREFFELVENRLTPDGVYMMNIISALEGRHADFHQAVGATLKSVFPHVYVFAVYPGFRRSAQNLILVATREPVDVKRALKDAGLEDVKRRNFSASFAGEFRPVKGKAVVFTDQRNPVEFMVARSQLHGGG